MEPFLASGFLLLLIAIALFIGIQEGRRTWEVLQRLEAERAGRQPQPQPAAE